MAKLPPLRACLIAEGVRPEPSNKSTIFGFLGVAPDVTIGLVTFPSNLNLAFIVSCQPDVLSQDYDIAVDMIGPGNFAMPRQGLPGVAEGSGRGLSPTGIIQIQGLPIPSPGQYTLRVYSDGGLHSENSFNVLLTSELEKRMRTLVTAHP